MPVTESIRTSELDSPRSKGSGCDHCRSTGYRGRIGIFELLSVTEATRSHIIARSPASRVKRSAVEDGMRTLREDGLSKVAAGVTTLDEVEQATLQDVEKTSVNDSNEETPR